jgi:hypothetical protein
MGDLRSRLAALGGFVEELESAGYSAGRWHPTERTSPDSDVLTLGWYELSDRALEFVKSVAGNGWVEPFDWPAWAQTDEARSLRDDRQALANASPDQLKRLLTTLVRGDRFSEGTLAWAFDTGLMAAIARRARTLSETVETDGEDG